MFQRHAAEGPERVLEVLDQRGEALAAQDHGGAFPAAIGQDEVEKPVLQRHATDGDAEPGRIREVRQRHPARLGRLAEDHVALGAVQGTPVADAALEGAADPVIGEGIRIGHLQVAQECHGLDGRIALEDRLQHRLPDRLERIWHGAAAGGLALGRKAGTGVRRRST